MKQFVMPVSYKNSPNRLKKVAKGDEKPTIEFTVGIGKPASPSLYQGVPLN